VRRVKPLGRIGPVGGIAHDILGRPLFKLLTARVKKRADVVRREKNRALQSVNHASCAGALVRPCLDRRETLPRHEDVAGELKGRGLRVKPLPVVAFMEETSAPAGDPRGEGDIQRPARDIHIVRGVVAALAGAPVMKPVPRIMHNIVLIRAARRRALPQIPIQPLRRSNLVAFADRPALRRIPAARKTRRADQAAVNLFDHLLVHRGRTALAAHLENRAVFFSRLDQHLALAGVERHRFLHIDRLARLHRHQRGRGMPMIRRGAHHRVHALVFQHPPQIFLCLGRLLRPLEHLGRRLAARTRVHIAHGRDLHTRQTRQRLHQAEPAPLDVTPHHRHTHRVGRCALAKSSRRDAGHRRTSQRRLHEIPSFHRILQFAFTSAQYGNDFAAFQQLHILEKTCTLLRNKQDAKRPFQPISAQRRIAVGNEAITESHRPVTEGFAAFLHEHPTVWDDKRFVHDSLAGLPFVIQFVHALEQPVPE